MGKANINESPKNGALHSRLAVTPEPDTKIMKETS
jgi:hypothetical protein